jgi:hypothetical protein
MGATPQDYATTVQDRSIAEVGQKETSTVGPKIAVASQGFG